MHEHALRVFPSRVKSGRSCKAVARLQLPDTSIHINRNTSFVINSKSSGILTMDPRFGALRPPGGSGAAASEWRSRRAVPSLAGDLVGASHRAVPPWSRISSQSRLCSRPYVMDLVAGGPPMPLLDRVCARFQVAWLGHFVCGSAALDFHFLLSDSHWLRPVRCWDANVARWRIL